MRSVYPEGTKNSNLARGRNQVHRGTTSHSLSLLQQINICIISPPLEPRSRLLSLICPVTVMECACVFYVCMCVREVWLSASMHKSVHVCMRSQQWVGWSRRRSRRRKRRPVVKALTEKLKIAQLLAGTQWSLAFAVKGTRAHAQQSTCRKGRKVHQKLQKK